MMIFIKHLYTYMGHEIAYNFYNLLLEYARSHAFARVCVCVMVGIVTIESHLFFVVVILM